MDNSPFFSVIVPVYNVSQYLKRCIDSILSQSYGDFELLLVDDGSTDDSGIICDDYAKKDNRIKVFHKKNGGVSSARNKGIDEACGKYIIFVDSDDYIFSNRLSIFANYAKELPDMITESGIVPADDKYCFRKVNYIDYKYITYVIIVWTSAFKKSIIDHNHIRFDESVSHGEDTYFILDYFQYIKSIIYLDKGKYVYESGHEIGLNMKFQSWEKELYIYKKINTLNLKLKNRYGLKEQCILLNNGQILRIVKALYVNLKHYDYSIKERISFLKVINKEYNKNEDIKGKLSGNSIILFLLQRSYYLLLDIFMKSIWIKRNKNI